MFTPALIYILIPTVLYVVFFGIETILSIAQMFSKSAAKSKQFVYLSWEVVHTLLIFSVASFTWLYADIINQVAHSVFGLLLWVGVLFVVRGVCFIILYYMEQKSFVFRQSIAAVFAASNITLVVLVLLVTQHVVVLLQNNPHVDVNTQFLPYMWPGLGLLLLFCVSPIVFQQTRQK